MFLLFKAVGLALSLAGAPPTLTLGQAIEIAESNSFGLKIAESNIEKTKQAIAEARGSGMPQISASAFYSRFDRLSIGGGFGGGSTTGSSTRDTKQADLNLTLPIDISGNIRRGVRAASLTNQTAELARETVRLDLRNQVRRAFMVVLQAQEIESLAQRSLGLSKERLSNTEALFQAGSLAKVEVLRAQTTVSNAETEVIKAQNRLTLAKQSLNNLLGREIDTEFEPAADIPMYQIPPNAPDLMKTAWALRPDVRSLLIRQDILALIRESQNRGLLPSLSLGARHSRDLADVASSSRTATSGTLTLNVPIYDGGITRARVNQAKEDEKQNRIQLDQLKLGVELQIRSTLSSLRDAASRLESATKAVELAEETYRLAKIRFEAGEGIQLEVSDAQTGLVQARTNLITARYDYLTAWADLQRALGSDDLGGRAKPWEVAK